MIINMKKLSILILFKGSAGEGDWLLPIVSKFSKKYNVFTYFKTKRAFSNFKENKIIYLKWKKINNKFYVDNFLRCFFWKIFRKIFIKLNISYNSDFFNDKIHNINYLKKKFLENNNNNFFKFIFSEFNYPNSWYENALKNNDNSLVVHYPHSPFITFFKKKYKRKYKLNGDILLLNSKLDKKRWIDFIPEKKIFSFGIPRFDPIWVRKILDFDKKTFKKNNKFIITIPYKSYFKTFPEKKTFLKNHFLEIIKVIMNNPKTVLYIKLHPRMRCEYSKKMILDLSKKYPNRIILTQKHLLNLAKFSDLFLCPTNSSTILDSIYFKTPTLQFQIPIKNIDLKENFNPYLEQKKISIILRDLKELKKIVKSLHKKKIDKRFKIQQLRFKKYFEYKYSIQKIENFLELKYDKKFN